MEQPDRFVPLRVGQVAAELNRLPWADGDESPQFAALTRIVSALLHVDFHERHRRVVEAWDRVNVDPEATDLVSAELASMADRANYEPVTKEELDDALERESLIRLKLDVDLDDYERVVICRRGSHTDTVTVPTWGGFRSEERSINVDERVIVHTRVKPRSWFEGRNIDPTDRNLVPDHVSLKQFRDVPRADIEMLLPSTQVRFRAVDSLVVGVPAVASGVAVLITKLLPTLGLMFLLIGAWLGIRDDRPELDQTALVVLFGGAITLGGFMFRQWSKLKNRRLEYLKTLTENLYFRTMADGPGVLHTLFSSAEEQETIEVVLAYRFLLDAPDGLTSDELDNRVESWLASRCERPIDFEVDDAVAKLDDLGLIVDRIGQDPVLRALPLDRSLAVLDRRWDDLFHHPAT